MKILVFNEKKEGNLLLNPYRHNLVFTKRSVEDLSNADVGSYEDETFICSGKKEKLIYAFVHLRNSWLIHSNRGSTSNYISEKDMRVFQSAHFLRWARTNFPIFEEYFSELTEMINNDSLPFYDTNAAVLRFPHYREEEFGIHVEFANAWINEFANNNYVMIGRTVPEILASKIVNERRDFIVLTNHMQLSSPYDISCEKDLLTKEFILHFWYKDAIVKIKL